LSAHDLPAGYARDRERGADVVALPAVMEAVLHCIAEAGTLHAWAAQRPDAVALQGRGAAHRVDLAGASCVVRHYRRGGLIGRFVADTYLRAGEPRPLRELRASCDVRAAGVPTPQVIAAVIYPNGPVYRADLATLHVPHGADLAAATWGDAAWPRDDRIAAWHATGRLLRRVFHAGVRHPDLNLRNIFVTRCGGVVDALLLDLDRAAVDEPDGRADAAMLARFHRSRARLEALHHTAADAALLRALDDGLAAPSAPPPAGDGPGSDS
jgi:3-deoxy-D-manno-octulosonic acid kinase